MYQKIEVKDSENNDNLEDFDPERMVFQDIYTHPVYNSKSTPIRYNYGNLDDDNPKLYSLNGEYPAKTAYFNRDEIPELDEDGNDTGKIKDIVYSLSLFLDPNPDTNIDGYETDKMIIDYVNSQYLECTKHVITIGLEGKLNKKEKRNLGKEFPDFLETPEKYEEELSDIINLQEKYQILRSPLYYAKKWKDEHDMVTDPSASCYFKVVVYKAKVIKTKKGEEKIQGRDSEFLFVDPDPDSNKIFQIPVDELISRRISRINGRFKIFLSKISLNGKDYTGSLKFGLGSCGIIDLFTGERQSRRGQVMREIKQNYGDNLSRAGGILAEILDDVENSKENQTTSRNTIYDTEESSEEESSDEEPTTVTNDEKQNVSDYLNFDESSSEESENTRKRRKKKSKKKK